MTALHVPKSVTVKSAIGMGAVLLFLLGMAVAVIGSISVINSLTDSFPGDVLSHTKVLIYSSLVTCTGLLVAMIGIITFFHSVLGYDFK